MRKNVMLITMLAGIFMITSSFITNNPTIEKKGTFTCIINDKPFVIEGLTGSLRKITGGETQLSFSNDRFIKFSFLNPVQDSKIDLAQQSRAAYIRYEDPSTSLVGKPANGYVHLTKIDEKNKVVSGTFEIVMSVTMPDGKVKNIKISQGKLVDVPIVLKQ
ncbi:MAG: hypothetical protein H7259_00100 [Cytophagales bacterium]|nr:hypothetical protein [Cytophaga sp.]